MKEAFDAFFEEMTQNYIKEWVEPPQAPCNEKRRPTGLFLLETLNDEGYAQWKPRLQENNVAFEIIEKTLGFSINSQIKEYFSTYWFLPLEAKLPIESHKVSFTLTGITPYTSIENVILQNFNRTGAHYLSDHNYFLLGTYCKIDGVDSYLVQVNNDTGEVTAVEVMDKKSIKLADSIEDLLYNMKGIW
jgi:hypothetical protein